MKKSVKISIVIPVYNGATFIKRCFDRLIKQNFKESFEIIIVNDASTDKSVEIIKKYKLPNLKLFSLPKNSGQSAARNIGIKKSVGEYIFFQDIDDLISYKTFSTLYKIAKKNNCDMICSDFKRIEKIKNQRKGRYNYTTNLVLNYDKINEKMIQELYNPSLGHLGIFGCNGRLIRRSIIIKNRIFFEEKMRLIEDKIFGWNLLSFCDKIIYVRKQLYTYYVNPNINTALTDSLNYGFGLKTVKLILFNIKKSLKRRGLSKIELEKYYQQGLIFFSIHALITISRPMFLGKIDFNKAKKIRRNIINEIFKDNEISKAIKKYVPSNQESSLIPKAIMLKSCILLERACNKRAKETIDMRREGKV